MSIICIKFKRTYEFEKNITEYYVIAAKRLNQNVLNKNINCIH